jgi:type IV pilus assembly protein PilM
MIGLDISSSSVKLVELGQTASASTCWSVSARELREGLDHRRPDREIRRGRRSRAPRGHQERHQDQAGRDGDAAVGRDHQEDHAAGRPARGRARVQVESEANQYIPFSLDEVSLDFCVIGPSPTSVGDVEVLIAASRKDRVQDRQGLAEAAGLKPVVLDIESHASRLAMSRVVATCPTKARTRWSRCSRSAPTPPA